MPNCKFCGESVTTGNVYHSECWEAKIHVLAERFCNRFCMWPRVCQSQESLSEHHCDKDCPLIELVNLGL